MKLENYKECENEVLKITPQDQPTNLKSFLYNVIKAFGAYNLFVCVEVNAILLTLEILIHEKNGH